MKTSLKVIFRTSTVEGHAGSIAYRLTHNRVTRLVTTDYKIYPSEWDEVSACLTATSSCSYFSVKSKNISINIISDALGHDSIQTTQVYLASIDSSAIDRANDIVIRDTSLTDEAGIRVSAEIA